MGGVMCSRQKPIRFLIQGLDASGKTSLLYKLKLGEVVITIPTIGFNVETLSHKGLEVVGWDLGGRDKIRPLYRHYYPGTVGIIYMIDSSDTDRLDDAIDELDDMILKTEELHQAVVMILANKQDLETALSPALIEERLRKKCPLISNSTFVMPCSVIEGNSMHEAFDKFLNNIKLKQKEELPSGLIPQAWELTDQDTSKDDNPSDSAGMFHRLKNSFLKDPFNLFKSVFFY